jgi:hypothetical protein
MEKTVDTGLRCLTPLQLSLLFHYHHKHECYDKDDFIAVLAHDEMSDMGLLECKAGHWFSTKLGTGHVRFILGMSIQLDRREKCVRRRGLI